MTSPASCLYPTLYLRRPPPPFNDDFMGIERNDSEVDEDYLPDVEDLVSGNFKEFIDLTGDSDDEGGAGHSPRPQGRRSDASFRTPSTMPKPSPFKETLLQAHQPFKIMCDPGSDYVEIPESPRIIEASPSASGANCHNDYGIGNEMPMATAVVTQAVSVHAEDHSNVGEEQEKEEWEEKAGDSGNDGYTFPSRQATTLLSTSPIHPPQVEHCSRTQSNVLTKDATDLDDGPLIRIKDVTFLRIVSQRETAHGPQHRCSGEIWLRADAGIPPNLLRNYKSEVTRTDRLATLRRRKRSNEETQMESTADTSRKRVKQA